MLSNIYLLFLPKQTYLQYLMNTENNPYLITIHITQSRFQRNFSIKIKRLKGEHLDKKSTYLSGEKLKFHLHINLDIFCPLNSIIVLKVFFILII